MKTKIETYKGYDIISGHTSLSGKVRVEHSKSHFFFHNFKSVRSAKINITKFLEQ